MPFNGSGVWSAAAADFPAVANTLIESTKYNNVINDLATGLTTCLLKDGTQTVTANIPFSGFFLTNAGLRSPNGTVGAPGIAFENDTDCGLYRIGTNNIGFAIAGAKVLDVNTTGVGVTGVLTTTGNVTVGTAGTGAANQLTLDGAATGSPFIQFNQNGVAKATIQYVNADSVVALESLTTRFYTATTSGASIRLPHGTAPTSPVNGDLWTTTAGLYVRINGATVGPLS